MSDERKLLIVGSGFAGLALAIALKRRGLEFRIFEATKAPSDIGGAVTIFPNGMRILDDLGLASAVRDAGSVITDVQFWDHQGRKIVASSMGTAEKYGQPTVTLRRSLLHRLLVDTAAAEGIQIEYGKRLVDVVSAENNVTARFSDSTEVKGSCLIGADGVHSPVRRSIFQNSADPFYAGLVYYGGFVPIRSLGANFRLNSNTQEVTVGPVGFFGFSYIDPINSPDPCLLWYCYLNQPRRLSKEELAEVGSEEIRSRVLEAHRGWHSPIETLIQKTTSFCKASVFDMVNLKRWSLKRVLIIGDAAHAMNPVSGQGASSAMEDALLLAELIQNQPQQIEEVFGQFENARKIRVQRLGQRARVSSRRTMIRFGTWGCRFRNLAYALLTKVTPESKAHWAFDYDVQKEKNKIFQDVRV
jgi:2-polyprenyl-6-methoxyphenol hydroxylase-like FAD-dependent oxidoreductase